MVCINAIKDVPTSKVQKKRENQKRLRMREYCNLKAIVPALACRTSVTKVTVVEEAIKYIDELQMALCDRLNSPDEKDVGPTTVQECGYPEPSPKPHEILIELNPHHNPSKVLRKTNSPPLRSTRR